MKKNFRQRPVFLIFFLSICFLGGLVFSGYLELSEVDIFFHHLRFEDQNLETLTTIGKTKIKLSISYFVHPLLPIYTFSWHASLILPLSLDNPTTRPIRC